MCNPRYVLSWVCNGCGVENMDYRDLSTSMDMGFWREELGEGHSTTDFSCEKCKKNSFTQWMTEEGCLRVKDEIVSRG